MLTCLFLKQIPILEQLQLEEALFRADEGNWCLINEGSSPAIVMGISQKVNEVVDEKRHQDLPIPLIRRFSGGGTVVVESKTVFVSLILNHKEVQCPVFPKNILAWTADLYRPLFGALPFALQENDYAIGDKKCGGNAQSFSKNRFVHHTSFLWDYSEGHMNLLKMPPKIPSYREGRSHQEFLQPLKAFFSSPDEFAQNILACISEKFTVKQTSWEEACEITRRPHRKSTNQII
jgi:lipoate---protein ligase